MKVILLLLMSMLLTEAGQAQDTVSTNNGLSRKVVIKLAPLALINPDPTVQGAVEIRTGPKQSWLGEFGYSRFRSAYGGDNQFTHREFWRARTEYRWYNRQGRRHRRNWVTRHYQAPVGSYWAAEGLFKQINVLDENTTGHDYSPSLGYAYYEKLQVPVSRFVGAAYGKLGRQVLIPRADGKPSHFLIDISFGLGIRYIKVVRYGIPVADEGMAHPVEMGFDNRFNEAFSKFVPDVTIGFKVGYSF